MMNLLQALRLFGTCCSFIVCNLLILGDVSAAEAWAKTDMQSILFKFLIIEKYVLIVQASGAEQKVLRVSAQY